MKKPILLWLISCLTLLATPDWADNTNETYLGSNEKSYATFLTQTDNQGSYYEWREVKKLNEYSKTDGSIINSAIISDILYSIDANHNNPNIQPKVTKSVISENKEVMLSTLITNFHLPLIPTKKPEWLTRVSWLDGNIVLDEQLTLVSKNILTGLKIPADILSTEPIEETILQVHSDAQSIYLVIKMETDTDYNTYVLHLSEEITKQLRDRINLLEEYIFIKSFKTFQEANAFGLEIIKTSQTKNFFGLNPEIWLSKVVDRNATPYSLVHRPLALPIDPEQIKRLDAAIGFNTSNIKSEHFIEKWIPYDPEAKTPAQLEEEEEDFPSDLIEEEIK